MIRQSLSRTFVRLKEWNEVKFHKDSGKWGPKAGKFFQHLLPAHLRSKMLDDYLFLNYLHVCTSLDSGIAKMPFNINLLVTVASLL